MEIGGKYNWRNQPERLVFLGRNWSGNGFWNQFALVSEPDVVWCEVTDSDLSRLEETKDPAPAVTPEPTGKKLSHRQAKRQRRAAKRIAQQGKEGAK